MKISIIRITAFMLIICVALYATNDVFRFKYSDGIYGMEKFYEEDDNTIDVLFLGSSRAFEDFNTGTLWDEYGIASYVLGGSMQPMWNTYYYLKEALKTQEPRLIVLEAYCTTLTEEYSDDSRIIKNTYGLKWSRDKIDSIKVSSPKERWMEFIFGYTQYHSRYKSIESADFLPDQGNAYYSDWKGYLCNTDVVPMDSIDVCTTQEKNMLYPKTEYWYRRVIEYTKEKGIPMLIVVSPYAGITIDDQKFLNQSGEIAGEYGVPFFNYNLYLEEIGIDYQIDNADGSHLNHNGSKKYSSYLGKYITENFYIPDRRGLSEYDSWQNNADWLRRSIYGE